MAHTYANTEDTFLIFSLVIIVFFVALVFYFNVIAPFMKAKAYIKMEIRRTVGDKQLYWKNELKKLNSKYIPFFGRFLK